MQMSNKESKFDEVLGRLLGYRYAILIHGLGCECAPASDMLLSVYRNASKMNEAYDEYIRVWQESERLVDDTTESYKRIYMLTMIE